MSTSRLPTEPTDQGDVDTEAPTQYITLVGYFHPGDGLNIYGVAPKECPPAFDYLARWVYNEALGQAGGVAPSTQGEWLQHVQSACATVSANINLPYPLRLATSGYDKLATANVAAEAELGLWGSARSIAWITVNKDDADDGRLSFWMSLPGEVVKVGTYDCLAQTTLINNSTAIATRSAVLLDSMPEWQLNANIHCVAHKKLDSGDKETDPYADLNWYKERVKHAAQRVLWDQSITHIRVATITRHVPLTWTSAVSMPMANSHRQVRGLTWFKSRAA